MTEKSVRHRRVKQRVIAPFVPVAGLGTHLAALPAPWTVFRQSKFSLFDGGHGEIYGGIYVVLHPEKGIALVDLAPAEPATALPRLRALLRETSFAPFSLDEPPLIAVALTGGDFGAVAERLSEVFSATAPCLIEDRGWSEIAISALASRYSELVRVQRAESAASAPAPEMAASPITQSRDEGAVPPQTADRQVEEPIWAVERAPKPAPQTGERQAHASARTAESMRVSGDEQEPKSSLAPAPSAAEVPGRTNATEADRDRASNHESKVEGAPGSESPARPNRSTPPTNAPRPDVLDTLGAALRALPAPWTVLHDKGGNDDGYGLGASFIALHPEIGIVLIDLSPAKPEAAIAWLRVLLIGVGEGTFTAREPPIAPVVLSRDEIPEAALRVEASLRECPACAIQDKAWPKVAIAALMAEHANLAPMERGPKAVPDEALQSAPEEATRAKPTSRRPPVAEPTSLSLRQDPGSSNAASSQGEPSFELAKVPVPEQEARLPHRDLGREQAPSALREWSRERPRLRIVKPKAPRESLGPSYVSAVPNERRPAPPHAPVVKRKTPLPCEELVFAQAPSTSSERVATSPRAQASSNEPHPAPPPRLRLVVEPEPDFLHANAPPTKPPQGHTRKRPAWLVVVGSFSAMAAAMLLYPRETAEPITPPKRVAEISSQQVVSATNPAPPAAGNLLSLGVNESPSKTSRPEASPPPGSAVTPNAPPTTPANLSANAPQSDMIASRTKEQTVVASTTAVEMAGASPGSKVGVTLKTKPPEIGVRPEKKAKTTGRQARSDVARSAGHATHRPPRKTADDMNDIAIVTSGGMDYVEGREPHALGSVTRPAQIASAAPSPPPMSQTAVDQRRPNALPPPGTDFSITPTGIMNPAGVVTPFGE